MIFYSQEIQGFMASPLLTLVVWLFIFITAGLLRLVFHWVPHWYLRVTHKKCLLAEATSLLLKVIIAEISKTRRGSYMSAHVLLNIWIKHVFLCITSSAGP